MTLDSLRNGERRARTLLALLVAALVVGTPLVLAGAAGAAPTTAGSLSGTGALGATASADSPPIMAFRTADTGNVAMYSRDGMITDLGVSAAVVGPLYDVDGDGLLEAIYVDGNGGINHVDREGETGSLAGDSAPTSKTMIAVGDRDGDGTPEVYYVNTNDNNYVYRVEPGGQPERVTATAAKAVLGIADFDGEGDEDLVFAGDSSTIKYYDGDVHSTGYSSIGSNNGYGAGAPADFDGDGVASVPIVDGSNNPALVHADGTKTAYTSGSAAKAPIAGVDVTGDGALDLVYVDKDGAVAYTTLDDATDTVADADGTAISATKKVGVVGASATPPPEITNYAVENPEERDVAVTFDSTRELASIEVTVTSDGDPVATLTEADFSESASGSGYTYAATYTAEADGNYTATMTAAADSAGKTAESTPEGSVAVDWRPAIDDYTVTNPEARELVVTFTSSERLPDIAVDVDGPETVTLTEADFNESETADGYRYRATVRVDADGTYDATLTSAVDDAGYDGADGETGAVAIETATPEVVDASVTDTTNRDGVVGADDRIRVTATVEGENVTAVRVDLAAIGAGTVTLEHTGGDNYAATVAVDVDAEDPSAAGAAVFTVTASNEYDNADSAATGSLVVDTVDPIAETGPNITVEEGSKVVLDAAGSRDNVGIARYVWELPAGQQVEGETVVHTFEEPGTYTVRLTVVDLAGNTGSATRTITVAGVDESTAATSNDSETVRVYETVRIVGDPAATDDSAAADDTTNSTANTSTTNGTDTADGIEHVVELDQVPVDAIKFAEEPSAGVLRAEHLASLPANVSEPPGRVVHPLRITLSNDSAVPATLVFTVDRTVIDDADPSAVTMLRYTNGGWERLETAVVERNGTSVTLAAETDGFSYFAVAVETTGADSAGTDPATAPAATATPTTDSAATNPGSTATAVPTGTVAGTTVASEESLSVGLLAFLAALFGCCLVGYWGYREGHLETVVARAQDAVDRYQV